MREHRRNCGFVYPLGVRKLLGTVDTPEEKRKLWDSLNPPFSEAKEGT